MITIARWTQPNYLARARQTGVPELLTIPYSHYVEYARWSLELGKKNFVEHGYMPGQHVLPILSLRVAGNEKFLSDSSFVTKVKGKSCKEQSLSQANYKRSTAVPALVLPNGKVLPDSWEIALHSGIEPGAVMDPGIKDLYDQELGPLARQFAYSIFLHPDNRAAWDRTLTDNQGWLWKTFYYFIGTYLWNLLRLIFQVGNSIEEEECERKLSKLFDKIEKTRLKNVLNGNSKFINGDEYTLEDLALCSLAGPVILPDGYCNNILEKAVLDVEANDTRGMARINKYRKTRLGAYVMDFYAKYR